MARPQLLGPPPTIEALAGLTLRTLRKRDAKRNATVRGVTAQLTERKESPRKTDDAAQENGAPPALSAPSALEPSEN